MADEIDLANSRIEMEMENILAQRANEPKPPTLAPKGVCYYCDAALEHSELYCDDECNAAHIYELEQRAHQRKVNGGTHYVRYGL
jgi:predicted nucleic acid-binding Zn ribbon protein